MIRVLIDCHERFSARSVVCISIDHHLLTINHLNPQNVILMDGPELVDICSERWPLTLLNCLPSHTAEKIILKRRKVEVPVAVGIYEKLSILDYIDQKNLPPERNNGLRARWRERYHRLNRGQNGEMRLAKDGRSSRRTRV